GPLARTVGACAVMRRARAGYAAQDPASAGVRVPDYRAAFSARLDGVRVGVIRHFHERDAVAQFGADNAPSTAYVDAFNQACRTLESLGARLVDLQLPPLIDYLDANRLILLAEGFALPATD